MRKTFAFVRVVQFALWLTVVAVVGWDVGARWRQTGDDGHGERAIPGSKLPAVQRLGRSELDRLIELRRQREAQATGDFAKRLADIDDGRSGRRPLEELDRLFAEWAERDPDGLLAYCGTDDAVAYGGLMRELLRCSPERALGFLSDPKHAVWRNRLDLSAALVSADERVRAAAWKILALPGASVDFSEADWRQLPALLLAKAPDVFDASLEASAAAQWVSADALSALAWLRSHRADDGEVLAAVAERISALGTAGRLGTDLPAVTSALRAWVEATGAEMLPSTVEGVALALAQGSDFSTARQLAETSLEGQARTALLEQIARREVQLAFQRSPDEARGLALAMQPGPPRDGALNAVFAQLAERDPLEALRFHAGLADDLSAARALSTAGGMDAGRAFLPLLAAPPAGVEVPRFVIERAARERAFTLGTEGAQEWLTTLPAGRIRDAAARVVMTSGGME